MNYETLLKSIDCMASDFLFLDSGDMDVPTTGKFLNHLENVAREALNLNIMPIQEVGRGLNSILECIILDSIEDKEAAILTFEQGIALLQEIVNVEKNQGKYQGDIRGYLERIAFVTGTSISSSDKEIVDEVQASKEKITAAGASEEFLIQDESLLRDFIAEGMEYVEEIEVNILNLENNPENRDYINAIFRPFHSIKGVASFLNLEKIRELSHNIESLLDKARNGEHSVTPPLIDVVLDGADALKSMISRLKEALEGKKENPLDVDLSALEMRIHNINKGIEQEPSVKKLGEILIDDGVLSEQMLEEGLKAKENNPEKRLGETLIKERAVTPKQVSQALRKQAEQITDMSTIRVDTRKLDDLIDMVGELVITQSMVQQNISNQENGNKDLARNVSQLFRITSNLQKVSTSLRMIPIKQTFQRMARLARDVSKNVGKAVVVEMEGEDTELDRNMVDEIYNPLVHMIRNSVDHGLETPEERVRCGKPEKGLIQLKAYHRGGNFVIEISDDGRGLNREKILKKAIQNHLVNSVEGLTDQEIYRMIFLPGFSTAEKVTDVSGRGVGMDVVRQTIEKLRGKIEIESIPGKGTTFITRFPLTMAIIDGMIVKVGKERFILPTTAIRQVLRPTRESHNHIVGQGETVNVMGRLMPLVRVYDLFDIEPEKVDPWDAIVIVVDGASRSKCLLVDQIIGKAEVVIKSLGEGLKDIDGISGGAIMGDGQIGLIIDPEGLFELSEHC
ncbi:chemotaxis protein CheA [Syntrophus aciditrophicus]|uniref:Chemotaxis protein CheA n=1 Tax=Syntrophus aciditrophicus (strain SB) TaxID=56780 RepID=Q2LSL2_SYNAS|nr:chemotaxis protein CheA [Syntrophus aciditrophicus]ABC77074.1 chemotaxis protein [Syntrophus aciditrophicus SB]OPY18260.1 MAG: Chemotaxis protein CheA [Syntrophus sp. PtaB.Bin075]